MRVCKVLPFNKKRLVPIYSQVKSSICFLQNAIFPSTFVYTKVDVFSARKFHAQAPKLCFFLRYYGLKGIRYFETLASDSVTFRLVLKNASTEQSL